MKRHRGSNGRSAAVAVIVAVGMLGAAKANAQITGGAFTPTGSDVVARFFHAGGMLNHRIVMVSGGLGLQLFPPSLFSRRDVGFYNPDTGTFSTAFTPLGGGAATQPLLLTARSSHTQTTLPDGRVLITGGHIGASGTSPGTATASVEIFDPQTGLITSGPAMAAARAMHTATMLPDGRVVVAGGGTWQIFLPNTTAWSVNFALARSRSAHAAVLLSHFDGVEGDHRILLIGGAGSGPATSELLNPADGGTVLLNSVLSTGVDDLAAVALADGRVFIAGGQDVSTGNTVSNTYILDPAADVIVPGPAVPNRPGGISDHEIARFTKYVAIFGGEEQLDGADAELNYAAIFDAGLGVWISNGTMSFLHDDFVSVPLPDCSLLLVGGGMPLFGQEFPSANCEIFTLTLPGRCRKGDFDDDGDVDLFDFADMDACMTGPDGGPVIWPCLPGDFDGDDDIDLRDAGAFMRQAGVDS